MGTILFPKQHFLSTSNGIPRRAFWCSGSAFHARSARDPHAGRSEGGVLAWLHSSHASTPPPPWQQGAAQRGEREKNGTPKRSGTPRQNSRHKRHRCIIIN